MKNTNYMKLALKLFLSFVSMYAIMFLNVDDISHIYLNMPRLYMTLLMSAAMAVLISSLVPKMYNCKCENSLIICSSVVVNDTPEAGVELAGNHLRQLKTVGIDLDQIAEKLENEGIEKFRQPFEKMLKTIAEKRIN